jgi:hypothetical protein
MSQTTRPWESSLPLNHLTDSGIALDYTKAAVGTDDGPCGACGSWRGLALAISGLKMPAHLFAQPVFNPYPSCKPKENPSLPWITMGMGHFAYRCRQPANGRSFSHNALDDIDNFSHTYWGAATDIEGYTIMRRDRSS